MPWASGTDGAGQESSLEGNQGAAGLAAGGHPVKICGPSSPQERCLQIGLFQCQANVCSCEGIRRRGDAGSL